MELKNPLYKNIGIHVSTSIFTVDKGVTKMSQPIAIGAYVLYGKTGVCQVQEYKDVRIGGETCSYYVLAPISDGRSSVYVPRNNAELVARMRPLLSREEIDSLLSAADDVRLEWLDDRFGQSRCA